MPDSMTREEHLAWCRERALIYLDGSSPGFALASMISDLTKHSETMPTRAQTDEGTRLVVADDAQGLRDWIEDFR